MKKRPFKLLLIRVGTSTSELVHEYLLEFEERCMEYMQYQYACKMQTVEDQQKQIREAPLIYELDDQITPETTVKLETVDDFHRHLNAHMYKTTAEEDLKRIAKEKGVTNPDGLTKTELIECLKMW